MTASRVLSQVSREAAVARATREFKEVPGEAEAEAVRKAFVHGGGSPAAMPLPMGAVSATMRQRMVERLQRQQGNSYVQRAVAGSAVQREPGESGCLVGLSQPAMVAEVQSRKASGEPLDDGVKGDMEKFFGADLGGVRVHADASAATLSRELNAHAFTVGSDIFFGYGKFSPETTDGRGTLAHELTHVGQQGGFGGPAPSAQRAGGEELQALAIQRDSEDEELQALAIQRDSEDEELQALAIQRDSEDEELQALAMQRDSEDEEDFGG